MPDGLNWDEFRIVKAIAETQSLAGAGERLGVNHSTMFRRLTALEARLGVRLFERERSGYRPTAEGEDMVSLAVLMGQTIEEFERRVGGEGVKLSGMVRLTTVNSIGCLILPPILAALRREHPNLSLDLTLCDAVIDLARGEADIALRCAKGPPGEGLKGRRITQVPWAIYVATSLRDRLGDFQISSAPWVAPSEACQPPSARRWVDQHVETWRRAATVNSDLVMCELAASGVGAALLPCFVAATRPQLQRVAGADADLDRELWLIANAQTLRLPRVRALYDFLGDELERNKHLFAAET